MDGIATDTDDKAIAIAILSLANTLGLSTVAEGVETALQLDELRMLVCDTAQGYFFQKPVEREHFRFLLRLCLPLTRLAEHQRPDSAKTAKIFCLSCNVCGLMCELLDGL